MSAVLVVDATVCALAAVCAYLPLAIVPVAAVALAAFRTLLVDGLTWHLALPGAAVAAALTNTYLLGGVWFYTLAVPASLLAGLGALLCFLVPCHLPFPSPSGAFNVARTNRTLFVKHGHGFEAAVFYPTLDATARTTYFHLKELPLGLATYLRMPRLEFVFSHLPVLRVDAVFDHYCKLAPTGPFGADALPVVILSHGLGGSPDVFYTFVQELVSHGVAVVCPGHTGGSAAAARRFERDGHPGEVRFFEGVPADKADDMGYVYEFRNDQLNTRTDECLAALEAVLAGHAGEGPLGDLLEGRVATEQVAVAGHSFGAATAVAAATRDSSFRVCICLDPWHFPLSEEQRRGPTKASFLAIFGEGFYNWKENFNVFASMARSDEDDVITIEGAQHLTFCDIPFLVHPIARQLFSTVSDLDQAKAHVIYTSIARAFLFARLGLDGEEWEKFAHRLPKHTFRGKDNPNDIDSPAS